MMCNDAIQALVAKGTVFRTDVHEKDRNIGHDSCDDCLIDLQRGLKQWFSQQERTLSMCGSLYPYL